MAPSVELDEEELTALNAVYLVEPAAPDGTRLPDLLRSEAGREWTAREANWWPVRRWAGTAGMSHGASVTEPEVLANADYMQKNLSAAWLGVRRRRHSAAQSRATSPIYQPFGAWKWTNIRWLVPAVKIAFPSAIWRSRVVAPLA